MSLLAALALACGGTAERKTLDSEDANGTDTSASSPGGAVADAPGGNGGTASVSGTGGSGAMVGGAGSVPSDTQLLQQACEHLATVRCSKLEKCSPGALASRYGTKQSCEAAERAQCWQRYEDTDDASASRRNVLILAEMIGVGTCAQSALDGYSSGPGAKPVGASCERFEQCASSYCELATGEFCGTCQPAPVLAEHAGEPCEITESSVGCTTPGLVCDLASETCVEPPGVGEACIRSGANPSPLDWCAATLICAGGTCVAPLFYGEACASADDHCNSREGLACSEAGTCDLVAPLHVEGACGGNPNAGSCGLADVCQSSAPAGDDRPGSCVPKASYGEPCSADLDCPSALACIQQNGAGGGSSGVCGTRPLVDHQCD